MEQLLQVASQAQNTKRLDRENVCSNSVETYPPPKRTREIEGTSNEGGILLSYFNFEKYRSSIILRKDEIWAIRDEYGMPRRYVVVERDGNINSVSVRYLKYNRKVTYQRYKSCGALHPCGIFVGDSDPEPFDLPSFSHKVVGWGNKKSTTKYTIYPRKGEVWAITKYTHCMFGFASPTLLKYQMVEVLEDYKSEEGAKVVTLVKVKGLYQSLFQRCHYENAKVVFHIGSQGSSMDWFSHQVPYFRFSGENPFGDYLELDPSSLPLCIDNNFEGGDEDNVINDNHLFLALLDKKVRYRKGDSLIWAAYDNEIRVPIKYVMGRPEKEAQTNKVKLAMHELTPCPVYAYEKRLEEAGLPIVCGNFSINPVASSRHFIISHRVRFRNKDCMLDNDYCYIHPIEGDVWGIYKESNMVSGQRTSKSKIKYQIVVIVARGDEGITVAYLVRVGGFRGLFRKKSGHSNQVQFLIPGNEYYRFSHKIPSYRFDGRGKEFLKGTFVLDPLLVPKMDAEYFSFDDPFMLESSNACPLWSAILYIVEKQRNGMSIDGQGNNNITLKRNLDNLVVKDIIDEQKPNAEEVDQDGIVYKQLNIKLHDFEDIISKADFELGQIWAVHSEVDGLPHSYVRINKFMSSREMVEVTLIEPHPITEEETHWVEKKFPMACGTFTTSQSTCVKDIAFFSHRVMCDEVMPKEVTLFWNQVKLFYAVFPRKGEVWAIYKNWTAHCNSSDMRNNCKYKLVEVVSDFTEETGVTVAALVRVEGHENIFKRQLHEDFGLYKSFKRKELLRFSHCIPSRQMVGLNGCNSYEKPIKLKFSHVGI